MNHLQSNVEHASRIGNNFLANLKLDTFSEGDLQKFINLFKLVLKLFHEKWLQEEGSHFIFDCNR